MACIESSAFDDILVELDETSDDEDIVRLVRYVLQNSLDSHDVASLAKKIAWAGASLPPSSTITADVPSTGGPSSLSTLICPLFLRLKGFTVPKLAVPGRPAGGVDVLATIPGYKTDLNRDEVIQCLEQCQYAHFRAGNDFVPLDARMFAIRQKVGAQDNSYLVIASLISKKIGSVSGSGSVRRTRWTSRQLRSDNRGGTCKRQDVQQCRENGRT